MLFVAPYFGFAGVISDTLAGNLAKKGHEVIVFGYVPPNNKRLFLEEKYKLEMKHIAFLEARAASFSIPGFVPAFPYFVSLENILQKTKPDIVHINCLPFLTSYQAAKIAKKLHYKSILQVHGVVGGGRFLTSLQELYNFTFGYSTFSNADRVICLTVSDAEKVSGYGCPKEKIRIIPNGVNLDDFQPCGREERNTILWGGRFVQQKGLKYLIAALKCVKSKDDSIRLTMTGDGLLAKVQQLVKKSGLDKNVAFLGRIPRKDIPTIINKSSIYVMPSLNEGMPYALLEAMACGKPVIGSNIPGIYDVITDRHNGFLVPPKDPESLANSILTLLRDDCLRQNMGQNARELMIKKYSWDTATKKIEKLYEETVA